MKKHALILTSMFVFFILMVPAASAVYIPPDPPKGNPLLTPEEEALIKKRGELTKHAQEVLEERLRYCRTVPLSPATYSLCVKEAHEHFRQALDDIDDFLKEPPELFIPPSPPPKTVWI